MNECNGCGKSTENATMYIIENGQLCFCDNCKWMMFLASHYPPR